ncbi:MAG: isochorismatase family cysteine hydrolase [Anaerolineae bacterium]
MTIDFIPGETVEVPEIPFKEEVELRADKTALVIVDMQNDFVHPDGALYVPAAKETLPRIRVFLGRARESGVHIAYTQDTHREGDPEWHQWPQHVRLGTWGWEIVDELKPAADELVCRKTRYDGFYGTELEHYLSRVWDVDSVVIVGTVSNICVLHTAASAGLRFFRLVMPADGVGALTNFGQAMTLRLVSWLYPGDVVRTTDDINLS